MMSPCRIDVGVFSIEGTVKVAGWYEHWGARSSSIHEPAPKPATLLRWGTGAVARRAQEASGQGAEQLEGYTWHGNRHTFASRLVMAGVDLRTVQQLGGWQSSGMVQRSSHLGPDNLLAAVERLVSSSDRAALGQD